MEAFNKRGGQRVLAAYLELMWIVIDHSAEPGRCGS